eukprot:scaffold21439_cov65-Skeletonema_dohrnii-CCMP3373.AAC.1
MSEVGVSWRVEETGKSILRPMMMAPSGRGDKVDDVEANAQTYFPKIVSDLAISGYRAGILPLAKCKIKHRT